MAPQHQHFLLNDCNVAPSQRACQTCHTTVTSQWRYGQSGKVLLCNACGIRWKRKNRTSDKKRLKPGPKRARHAASTPTSVPQSHVLQPSISAMYFRPNSNSTINKNVSSSSTITDPCPELLPVRKRSQHAYQQTSSTRPKSSRSKMDLDQLVSPMDTCTAVVRRDTHKLQRGANSSPISINNLLNFTDEDGARTVCSRPKAVLARGH